MICPNAKCARDIPDDAALCCYCGRSILRKSPARRHARGNGSGTAWKRGNTWTAIYTVGWKRDESGKNRQVRVTKGGFKTRKDALEYCIVMKNSNVRPEKSPNLLHYWEIYKDGDLPKLSRDKQYAYKKAWQRMEKLQYRPMDSLTVKDLRDVVEENTSTYYPARDMKTVFTHLFDLAGADRWVDKSLPEYIVLPDLNEKERKPFTEEEQKALWKLYDNGDTRAAVPLVMIYTGMMPGEFQNLKLDMIHIDEQRIVGASMKTKVRKASPIFLPDTIVPVVIDLMQRSASKSGYLLAHNEDAFYKDYYDVLSAAGCRRLEPYCCRHTTATALAIDKTIAPQTIRKVMRWSTTKMLDKYAHPDDNDAMEAINTLTRQPDKPDPPPNTTE